MKKIFIFIFIFVFIKYSFSQSVIKVDYKNIELEGKKQSDIDINDKKNRMKIYSNVRLEDIIELNNMNAMSIDEQEKIKSILSNKKYNNLTQEELENLINIKLKKYLKSYKNSKDNTVIKIYSTDNIVKEREKMNRVLNWIKRAPCDKYKFKEQRIHKAFRSSRNEMCGNRFYKKLVSQMRKTSPKTFEEFCSKVLDKTLFWKRKKKIIIYSKKSKKMYNLKDFIESRFLFEKKVFPKFCEEDIMQDLASKGKKGIEITKEDPKLDKLEAETFRDINKIKQQLYKIEKGLKENKDRDYLKKEFEKIDKFTLNTIRDLEDSDNEKLALAAGNVIKRYNNLEKELNGLLSKMIDSSKSALSTAIGVVKKGDTTEFQEYKSDLNSKFNDFKKDNSN